jgi:YidC/Oxa1 family membrane protein insertase
METMKLYKEKQINPFSSIFLLFIQLPILWALYRIFYSTGLNAVDASMLYSFVELPPTISTLFLGLIDVSDKSWVLALCAAISQFFQIKFSSPALPQKTEKGGFQEDFARNMQLQMKYIFPVMIFFISYHVAAALAIYWTTSNLFMIGQELYIRRQLKKEGVIKTA